jgi:SagB-type dehydrogenase family enzyme
MEKENASEQKVVLTRVDEPNFKYILPSPINRGSVSVEEALWRRRSHRLFLKDAITSLNISQILWAAYGVTKPVTRSLLTRGGLRAAPSAGATYPLEIYALIGNIEDIEPGVYKYIPQTHEIVGVIKNDIKKELSIAAQNQEMISVAPACLLFSAVVSRMTKRYGDRGHKRYLGMDLGHSAQNVYLQAEALNLGTCAIGAFNDAEVKKVMQLPDEEEPLYIMPIGKYISYI